MERDGFGSMVRATLTRMKTAVIFVLIATLLAACGDEGRPGLSDATSSAPPTPGHSPTPALPDPPFTIEGPISAANPGERFDNLSAESTKLILTSDLTTAWIVRPDLLDAESHRYASLQFAWLDDNRVGIVTSRGAYAYRPGEAIEPISLVIPTATPRPMLSLSSDRAWYAESRRNEPYFDTFVGQIDAEPSFRITNAVAGAWSPTDPTHLALLGSPCVFPGLFDVLLFDTEDASLRSLTTDLPGDVSMFLTNFAWQPDGRRIAIETWGVNGARSRLVLVDVTTGTVDSVALDPHAGSIPEAWSPSGELLLVGFEMAHGGLFCEQSSEWQPSSVERLER